MSTSWGLGLVLGPALGGYLSQVPMETKVPKTIHDSFLESCKIVKLNFFWVGFFTACHEISKYFCGRIPLCTVSCGKVLKILNAYWFLDFYLFILMGLYWHVEARMWKKMMDVVWMSMWMAGFLTSCHHCATLYLPLHFSSSFFNSLYVEL